MDNLTDKEKFLIYLGLCHVLSTANEVLNTSNWENNPGGKAGWIERQEITHALIEKFCPTPETIVIKR